MDGRVFWISVILLLPLSSSSFDVSVLNGSESLSPSSSRTLVSRGEVFELGFFETEAKGGWYLGIWYKREPETERSYVWVANRDNPLKNVNGTFQISGENLVICDPNYNNSSIWSTRTTAEEYKNPTAVVAHLLANGNLLLRYSIENEPGIFALWQSFDSPSDTLIPGMELGTDSNFMEKNLTSWTSFADPSRGQYTLRSQSLGPPGLDIVKEGGSRVYRSGLWNGSLFANLPKKLFSLTSNRYNQTIYKYVGINSSYSRLRLLSNGSLMEYTWNNLTARWETSWESTPEPCDAENVSCTCGANQFYQLTLMSFPPNWNRVDFINDTQACRDVCVTVCECTAYSYTNSLTLNRFTCVIWISKLDDLRSYSHGGGLLLYIKQNERSKKKNNIGVIVGLSLGIPAVFLFSLAMFCYWKRSQALRARANEIQIELAPPDSINDAGVIVNPPIPPMDFGTILQATDIGLLWQILVDSRLTFFLNSNPTMTKPLELVVM